METRSEECENKELEAWTRALSRVLVMEAGEET